MRLLRLVLRPLLGTALVGVLVLATGPPASAHASLLSTDPAQGSTVAVAPRQVVLTFNEPIRLDTDGVHAFLPGGGDWAVEARAEDNRLVVTPDGDPGTGTVVVAWKVISADGHVVGGALTFAIGTPSAGTAAPEAPASVLVARDAAVVVSLAALVGLAVLLVAGSGGRAVLVLWDTALATALLAVPLTQLVADGRGPGGLTDWLVWLDGLTRPRTLVVVAAVLLAGLVARGRSRLLGGASLLATSAVAAGLVLTGGGGTVAPPPVTDLGNAGTVQLDVRPTTGREFELDLKLSDTGGDPLHSVATPTLTVSDRQVDLGDAALRRTGPGAYSAIVTIPRDGDWTAQVSVRVSEFENPVAEVPFTIS